MGDFRMKKFIWAMFSALLALSAASAASAQTYTYNFSGSFGLNSGTVTGQFTYNQATNTFSAASVTTTAGTGPFGAAPGATYNVIHAGTDSVLVLRAGPAGIGQGSIDINFSPVLTNATPAINGVFEGTCQDATCNSRGFNRQGYSASTFSRILVAAVPTMSEWAMILLGLMLAGMTALYLQRRQVAA